MKFNRSSLIWPIRDIVNFIIYRRYIKQFNLDTKEGRKWLYNLRRDVQLMGFNEGVEAFERYYEAKKKIGRSMVESKLAREAKFQKSYELQNQIELARRKNELEEAKKQQEEKQKKKENERKPYNPNWQPTIDEIINFEPMATKEEYVGLIRKEYDIKEQGAYVVIVEFNNMIQKVLYGESLLKVLGETVRFEDQFALANKLPKNTPITQNNNKPRIKITSDDDIEIDISHVNKAMGNDINNNNDGIDDLLDDIF